MVDRRRVVRSHAINRYPLLALIAPLLATACEPTQIGPSDPGMPSFQSYCIGSSQQCNEIDNAITGLEGSSDPACQGLGTSARQRYNSSSFGFVVQQAPNPAWYGWTDPPEYYLPDPGDNFLDGYTSGITYIDPDAFTNGVAGMITIHEEAHHHGIYDEDEAWNLTGQCYQ